MTKIQKLLLDRDMTQGDLINLIKKKSGFRFGRDRISKICSGKLTNYHLESAVMISEALECPINDIVEMSDIKKENIN